MIFDSNGGSPVESQMVKENDRVIKPADPVRSGYTFDGWFTALNGGQIYNFNTAITGNITLYAHWTEADVPTYTVTFDSNGGSPVASQTVKENERVIKPADPTRSGYIFTGWYFSITGGEAYDFNSAVTENITLYANWINSQMSVKRLGMDYRVKSVGRYTNWAGISNVSQFADEQGRFCFAFCDENAVTVIKMNGTEIMDTLQLPKLYPLFGTAACDDNGNLYLVWGRENESDDTNIETIFVSKYSSKGELIATVGGNGSEGLAYYYDDSFNTKIPFHAGNCDVAINGNLLMVNYARTMYSGHQSNGIFAINVDNMTVNTNFVNYNSHSFDQRVTPFQSTGGFLIQSQGDCFPRAFTTTVTDASSALAEVESFHFWVQNGAYSDYNMFFLNRTYALLGNILDSGDKAALVGASARSLSENALYEPYDIFIQIFNPRGLREDLNTYVTSGTRSGLGGNDGNVEMTDYGVKWLTDFAGTEKTVDVVQAVTTRLGNIVVLYELYNESTWSFDSTWYMILDAKGNVIQEAQNLGNVRLNTDEDPVSVNGTVQWISNQQDGDELGLNVLAAD